MDPEEVKRIKTLVAEHTNEWPKVHIKQGSGEYEGMWFITGLAHFEAFGSRADACRWTSAFFLYLANRYDHEEKTADETDLS